MMATKGLISDMMLSVTVHWHGKVLFTAIMAH